jgi:hypothetical protein
MSGFVPLQFPYFEMNLPYYSTHWMTTDTEFELKKELFEAQLKRIEDYLTESACEARTEEEKSLLHQIRVVLDVAAQVHKENYFSAGEIDARYNCCSDLAHDLDKKKLRASKEHHHERLDQLTQVLGYVCLLYFPNKVDHRAEEESGLMSTHWPKFTQLSGEVYNLSFQEKLDAFIPLIDELSGHEYALFRNLGKALMGFALVATAVMVTAYVCPVVGAAVLGAILKLGIAKPVVDTGIIAIAGASFFYAGRQQGLSKAVDSLVQLPEPRLA